MKLGLHAPNLQWRRWSASFLRVCQQLRPVAVVLLAYENSAATAGHVEDAQRLAEAIPGVRLLVRCYGPGEWDRDPIQWAGECERRMGRYWGLNPECIPANEPNLESALSWGEQADWLRRFALEFRRLRPDVPLHLPALAPKLGYTDGWRAYQQAGLGSLFSIVDAHVYFGDGNLQDPAELSMMFGLLCDVTEFHSARSGGGFEDPGPWLRGLPARVRSASWFLADSDDTAFDYCSLAKQPAAVELLARYVEGKPMKTLTHWVSPVQGNAPQTVMECVHRARAATPMGWHPRVLIPAVYGSDWQANLRNTCGMEIRPKDAPDLRWVADRFAEQNMPMGAWGVPRDLTYAEGQQHGWAASVVDVYVLDLEPYDGFLIAPFDRAPEDFIAGFMSACDRPPHVSVVPQPSGIDPLGSALSHWLQWATVIRPQCYWSDFSSLNPAESLPYLGRLIKSARLQRRVIPIYPSNGGDRLAMLLGRARSDRDIWTI